MNISTFAPRASTRPRPNPEVTTPDPTVAARLRKADRLLGALTGAATAVLPALAFSANPGTGLITSLVSVPTSAMVASSVGRGVWRNVDGDLNSDHIKSGFLGVGLNVGGAILGAALPGPVGIAVAAAAGAVIGAIGLTPSYFDMQGNTAGDVPLSSQFADKAGIKADLYRAGTLRNALTCLPTCELLAVSGSLVFGVTAQSWPVFLGGLGVAAGYAALEHLGDKAATAARQRAEAANNQSHTYTEQQMHNLEGFAGYDEV